MTKPADPSAHSTASPAGPARRKPKATAAARRSRPVQLTIFDYAASIGITLLPEAS
jgi:hypothetical protein